MADNKVHHDCSEKVWREGYHGYGCRCMKPGKVERMVKRSVYPPAAKLYDEATFQFTEVNNPPYQVEEPKWFCGTHDPVAKAVRDEKRRAEEHAAWRAKREREDAYRNANELMSKRRQAVIDAAIALVKAENGAGRFPVLVAAVAALEDK
jgi:hypothetical protein